MRIRTWSRSGMSMLLALTLSPLGWAADLKNTVATQCPKRPQNGKLVELNPAHFDGCIKVRDIDQQVVLALGEKSPFGSGCPTFVDRLITVHQPSQCSMVEGALELGDMLRVDDWGDGQFGLSLRRGTNLIVPGVLLSPTTVTINGASKTVGFHAEVALNGQTVRYQIYLEHDGVTSGGNKKLRKRYAVEVFEPTAACLAEIPGAQATITDCDAHFVEVKPGDDEPDGQLPSGGGGEPPPK